MRIGELAMSPKKKGGTLKKGFNLSRDSVYVADPTTELSIHGARGIVHKDELGDLDTPPNDKMKVDDRRRLATILEDGFLADIDRAGVRVPIIIAKIDDVAVVIEGKSRVRAARRSNRARAKDGRPPIRIRCVVQRDTSDLALMGTMIASNNARRDDSLVDRIEKLRRFLSMGGSEVDAAIYFNVGHKTILGWLAFDDHATDETKAAAREGRLSASAAAELAKIKDPDAQRTALGKMIGAPGTKPRSASSVKRLVAGNEAKTATDRRSQVSLLRHIIAHDLIAHESSNGDTHKIGYWEGVLHALALVTGRASDLSIEIHKDLTKQLALMRKDIEKKKSKSNKNDAEDADSPGRTSDIEHTGNHSLHTEH